MTTVASPVTIREQALAAIAASIGPSDSSRRLMEIGGAVVAELLVRLERRFDIGLDVDEVLPNGTVGVLVNLVELRAQAAQAAQAEAAAALAGKVYHWDDERARRGRPHFCGRPQLAVANAPDFNVAPPAWPDLAEPARRSPVAVPPPEAWDRERARRAQMITVAAVCGSAALGLFCAWLALAGFI